MHGRRRRADDRRERVLIDRASHHSLCLDKQSTLRDDLLRRRRRRERERAVGHLADGLVLQCEIVQDALRERNRARVLLAGRTPLVHNAALVDIEANAVVAIGVKGEDLGVVGLHVSGPADAEGACLDAGARGRVAAAPVEVDRGIRLRDSSAGEARCAEVGAIQTVALHVSALDGHLVRGRPRDGVLDLILSVLVEVGVRGFTGSFQLVIRLMDERAMERGVRGCSIEQRCASNKAVVRGVTLVVVGVARREREGARDTRSADRERAVRVRHRALCSTNHCWLHVHPQDLIGAQTLSPAALIAAVVAIVSGTAVLELGRAPIDLCPLAGARRLAVLESRDTVLVEVHFPFIEVVAFDCGRRADLEETIRAHHGLCTRASFGRRSRAVANILKAVVLPLELDATVGVGCINLVVHHQVVVVIGDGKGKRSRGIHGGQRGPLRNHKAVVDPELHALLCRPRSARAMKGRVKGVLIGTAGLDESRPAHTELAIHHAICCAGVRAVGGGGARPVDG